MEGTIYVHVRGQRHEAHVVVQDPNYDLAILKVNANLGTLPYSLASDYAKEGEAVFTHRLPAYRHYGFYAQVNPWHY